MVATIRSRLLLLVLSWVIPAVAGAAWMIHATAKAEREANERTLQESARALSTVVDRELGRRRTLANVMAVSRSLDRLPELDPADAQAFVARARQALADMDGWIEVSVPGRVLVDTRPGTHPTPPQRAHEPRRLVDEAVVLPLHRDADTPLHAAVVTPIRREGRTVANLAVTILPSELQRMVDGQEMPADWVGTVIDGAQRVVARHPGGSQFAGRLSTNDLRERLARAPEGAFESVSLDGVAVSGYYKTSPQGWTFVTAMPRAPSGGFLRKAVVQVGAGALVLLALAVAGALWVSRGIARPVVSLKQAAARLQAGQPVAPAGTGIAECDEVEAALAEASDSLRQARGELERQVADAVARTRDAEQRLSHSERVEALGRLTGGVAHDFNNLLGVIANSARLVQRHAAEGGSAQAPAAAILRAVDVGSRLTQQLLRFAGRRPVNPQPIDPARWLPDLAELLANVVGERIGVSIDVASGTRAVTVDGGELELAIINLALNARDAMPAGGRLRLSARNAAPGELDGLPPQPFVAITVADDGPGVAPEASTRVFEPFFTTKPVGRGTGLGLSQVHGFCAQAGGTARLTSVAGHGTTVTLLLPATADAAPPAGPAPTRPAAQALRGVRVLLVEDDADLGDTTAALLAAYGCELERAGGADAALLAADTRGPFDAVLSDVAMPGGLDGLGLARAIRERHPRLPVVLVSGYSAALAQPGEFVVLRKPCSDEALVEALLDAVGGPVDADAG